MFLTFILFHSKYFLKPHGRNTATWRHSRGHRKCLQTVFVYINENSCCFHQCLKKCLQSLDIFPLRHCTQAWKFSAFKRKSPFLKTVFVVSEINVDPARNRIQKFFCEWLYCFRLLRYHCCFIFRQLVAN